MLLDRLAPVYVTDGDDRGSTSCAPPARSVRSPSACTRGRSSTSRCGHVLKPCDGAGRCSSSCACPSASCTASCGPIVGPYHPILSSATRTTRAFSPASSTGRTSAIDRVRDTASSAGPAGASDSSPDTLRSTLVVASMRLLAVGTAGLLQLAATGGHAFSLPEGKPGA